MKRRIFLGIMAGAILAGCGPEGKKDERIYTCSMHPQVRHKGPGRCPYCGMELTPVAAAQGPAGEAAKAAVPVVQLMPAQESVASVQTTEAGPFDMVRKVAIFGEIAYILDQHQDFSWFYPGRVERLLIPYNTTRVREGQPLLEIYSQDAIADQEAYLKAVRDRYLTTFYERKVAEAQVEAMRARLRQAGFSGQDLDDLIGKKAIKQTLVLRSPHTGTIVGPMPHVGERISPDSVLFHIVNLDQVWFVGRVYEQDLGLLKMGQTVEIETKAYPGRKFSGNLVFVDREVDPETRTIMARFEVQNPKGELLPKLSGTGNLVVDLGRVPVTVPLSALIDTGKRKVVYVETAPRTYEQREVRAGREMDDRLEILDGVKAGEKVVSGGAFLMDAEAQLKNAR